jgi:hypothetical protein
VPQDAFADGTPSAGRLLLDVSGDRVMAFAAGHADHVVYSVEGGRTVFMPAVAAGAGGRSSGNLLHGRLPSPRAADLPSTSASPLAELIGTTVAIDLAYPLLHLSGGASLMSERPVYDFFRRVNPRGHQWMAASGRPAAAPGRNLRNRFGRGGCGAAIGQAGRHCFFVGEVRGWWC